MTPSYAASLDIAFDELVPGEMWIGGTTVSEDAEMDDEATPASTAASVIVFI